MRPGRPAPLALLTIGAALQTLGRPRADVAYVYCWKPGASRSANCWLEVHAYPKADRASRQAIADRMYLERRKNQANFAERVIFDSAHQVQPRNFDIGRTELTEVRDRIPADGVISAGAQFREFARQYEFVAVVVLAIFPAVWVVWAFLTRGGLTLPLTGLALVRADGRKAARWQCA